MNIIEKRIDEIIPYEKNPRRNDKAVAYVVNSIKQFGFKVPLVIDKDNVIVCGHTRWKAAKRLKMKTLPCVIADDLTEEQIRAFRLADNKVAEIADWDFPMLNFELDSMKDFFDFSDFGFDFSDTRLGSEEKAPMETTEDDFDIDGSLKEKSEVKKGDVYLLGRHRLMCGDSVDDNDIAVLMNGQHGRMIFTSPPYSDLRTYEGGKNLNVDNLAQFIGKYKNYVDFECVNLGLKFKDKEVDQYWNKYIELAHNAGMKLLSWNVWNKNDAGSIGMQKHMFPVWHEWIFVFGENPEETNKTMEKKSFGRQSLNTGIRNPDGTMKLTSRGDTSGKYKSMGSVITAYCEKHNEIRKTHPATFPVKLPAEYVQALTDENDIVVEPFCGSGTTLIACEQLNRVCYGMELEPKYCKVIIDRWEKFTGQKAVKIA